MRGVCLGQMGSSEDDSMQEQKRMKQHLPGLPLQYTSLISSLLSLLSSLFFSLPSFPSATRHNLLLYVQPDMQRTLPRPLVGVWVSPKA